jgi:hypothetical protein
LTVQPIVVQVIDVDSSISHTHYEAVQELRGGPAAGFAHLAYAVHHSFGSCGAPFELRHSFVIGIIDESDEALR